MIKKQTDLIMVMPDSNNNKWYKLVLTEDGDVISSYGRVGYSGQEKNYGRIGERGFNSKIASKIKKGYTELKLISDSIQIISPQKRDLADLAKRQIGVTDPLLGNLIERLVKANVHNILSSTSIKLSDDGLFKTPLGIVTLDAIDEARTILAELKRSWDDKQNPSSLFSQYLRLIPHNYGMRLNIDSILSDKFFSDELNILDSLESSYNIAVSQPAKATDTNIIEPNKVFHLDLGLLNDNKEFDRINKYFESTKKSMHHYDKLKIKNIYATDFKEYNSNFNSKIGNIQEVFHGTSEANLISIFKSGLKVSPPSTAYIAGKLHGNGVYGSQTSSKSLGYSAGRWGGSFGNSYWIFVLDFAMGKAFYPQSYGSKGPPSGYDSTWALPKLTGLYNDELIVFQENQINIKYLLEIA